ncbi:MAG: tetratricopeptide repeat protein [Planctomycetes bacterium]|nr:tetratricopeptide repeat protein [Planctomycetota bacterium]
MAAALFPPGGERGGAIGKRPRARPCIAEARGLPVHRHGQGFRRSRIRRPGFRESPPWDRGGGCPCTSSRAWRRLASDAWLAVFEFEDGGDPATFLIRGSAWRPDPEDWEAIKRRSREKDARVTILGFAERAPGTILSRGRLAIRTSADEVGAPIFYREVNLPFIEAVKDPTRIRWRFGSVASREQPPVILEKLPVCGNCHSFPRDAETLAMDVDYANSKGSYVMTRVAGEMALSTSDIITWNDFRKEDGEQTFGLLSQISPDGRYVVSTVKDKSVFVPKPDLDFSQLFFPIKGILAVYDRRAKTFGSLPGADDPAYVQSNPMWSPDGTSIVFARAKAYSLLSTRGQGKVLLSREECLEFLRDGKPFLFDLYRIPFNEGAGGTPEPIPGASKDGMSNYFARFSPDGRWIVFCKAKSYMLLQPDSELFIIPAEGGEARRLRGNTVRMNSWHSFSPNGRWLVFSSKANGPYTQLFLTHIDERGESAPPVLLERFTSPDGAANIPEFVAASPKAIRRIREDFLNDYSFLRAGNEFFKAGEADPAIREYRKAIEINPANAEAHQKLGFLLYHVKGLEEEGLAHAQEAVRLDPRSPTARYDRGMTLLSRGKLDEAIDDLMYALRALPRGLDLQYNPVDMRYHLGRALNLKGRYEEASALLSEAIRLAPRHAKAHHQLALALALRGGIDEPAAEYALAVKLDPSVDGIAALPDLLGINCAKAGRFVEAVEWEKRAFGMATRAGDQAMARAIRDRIALFERNRPYVPPDSGGTMP